MPEASSTSAASVDETRPISATFPSLMAMSARRRGTIWPSMTMPPLMTLSYNGDTALTSLAPEEIVLNSR